MNTTYVLLALCWGISTLNLALALRLAIPHHPMTGPARSPLRRSRPCTAGEGHEVGVALPGSTSSERKHRR